MAAPTSETDIVSSELEDYIKDTIKVPAQAAVFWHDQNLPYWGNRAVVDTAVVTGTVDPGDGGSNVSASEIVEAISSLAVNASRIRRAHFYKSASGTDPSRNCSYGDSGTQITSLTTQYAISNSNRTESGVAANGNIYSEADADGSDLTGAITTAASTLASDRVSAGILNFPSCHCSCHSNCHSNRNRR